MPSPNDRRRGVWSHWVPLVVTVTIASAGLVAWALTQRKDEEYPAHEQEHEHLDYENADYGDNPPYGASNRNAGPGPGPDSQSRPGYNAPPPRQGDDSYGAPAEASGSNWGARMSGALRRTPSPQQFFDSTGKTITAGVAAAGAVIGKTLASIREEDKYPDDSRVWSEEADAKKDRGPASGDKRRRTVAVVVSADGALGHFADDDAHEHASILSHIPRHNDFSRIKLFVLIYAPDLKDNALENATSNLPPPSLSSSFSNIGHDQAQTPGEETKSPIASTENAAFNAVYSQALALVDKETMILPFTTPNGHVHILRHLQPDVIYLQESLSGDNGSIITNMQAWLRHDIMLVVGAESGSGGLADSESEAERATKTQQWWQRPDRVGRGRGIIVVDSMRVNDDWARRVNGIE